MLFCSVYYHQKANINTSPFYNWTQHAEKCEICERAQLLQKGVTGKWMLKLKAAWKDRPKNDVKDSTWTRNFFNSLSSQIKSDDIPSEVKLLSIMMLIAQILIHISPFVAAIAVVKQWKSQ